MQNIVLSVLVALGLTACAAAATDAKALKLEGEIHIKGSAAFPNVVLETASHQSWELVGVPLDEARGLVGHEVTVEGAVIKAPGQGVWLPSFRVDGKPRPSAP